MKRLILILFILINVLSFKASHIVGGDFKIDMVTNGIGKCGCPILLPNISRLLPIFISGTHVATFSTTPMRETSIRKKGKSFAFCQTGGRSTT